MYAIQMGLCAQDLVCAGSSPFQSVINCLVCIGRKQLCNELGAVGCVGRTYSRSLWKWRLLGGLCLQCWLLACIGVRRLKVDMYMGRQHVTLCLYQVGRGMGMAYPTSKEEQFKPLRCNANGPLCSRLGAHGQ